MQIIQPSAARRHFQRRLIIDACKFLCAGPVTGPGIEHCRIALCIDRKLPHPFFQLFITGDAFIIPCGRRCVKALRTAASECSALVRRPDPTKNKTPAPPLFQESGTGRGMYAIVCVHSGRGAARFYMLTLRPVSTRGRRATRVCRPAG